MKKVVVFAGNLRQFDDFVRSHRFLNRTNAEYCCSEEKIRGIGTPENPIRFILTGEFWLNPAYRGHYFSQMQEMWRAIELKNDQEICKYLEIEWVPEDLGIKIDESVGSQDGLV